MNINYDGKIFKPKATTENGQVDSETTFYYHQKDNIVWAEYLGGDVQMGTLIAKIDSGNNLRMRYQHIDKAGELMTGKCFSRPKLLYDGRIQLIETWQWTSGDNSKGESIVEEIL